MRIKFGDVARRLPATRPQGDFSHGGGLAREAATAQLRWSVQVLDSRCPEAVRGELHTAVADLAGVAAWMSFDGSPTTIHGGCFGLRSAAWVSTTGIYGQCCCAIWPARRSGAAIRTLALTYVELARVRADRLTATERAMASTVRGPPRPHPWRFQLSCSASPMMMPSGPRRKQSR
jgi:hypothetical protein